ncbi:MAG: ABC transporter permease, partial [Muribaculaceae bacterium]|nr:ABC transporter permease [Muribaculaceae bacterium]
ILVPILFIAFSVFIGFLMADSDSIQKMANPAAPDPDEMTGPQVLGMLCGIFLALFLMVYGSQIFAKVKKEKVNRIMEVLATCVTGRTMMLGKIISVGLLGFTQLLIWIGLIIIGIISIFTVLKPDIDFSIFQDPQIYIGFLWTLLFFIGGYIFYGSIYAACGALTDKDNENQAYMTVITMMLLMSFYIGEYAVTHANNFFVVFCSFFPFTAPTIASVNAVASEVPVWQSILSLIVLYGFAGLALSLSGKIYTASILLKGKKFTPKDILLFLKMK